MRANKTTVCWISSARYSAPLDAASGRKWQLLTRLRDFDIRVIGFSNSLRPRRFREHVGFYLIPKPPTSILRYLTIFLLAPPLLAILVFRQRGAIIVAQSPFEGAIGAAVKRFARLFGRHPRLIVENHNNFEEDVFLQRSIPLQEVLSRVDAGAGALRLPACRCPARDLHLDSGTSAQLCADAAGKCNS